MSNDPYENPETTDDTFDERIGPPDKCSASLGQVIIRFSQLEDCLTAAIAKVGGLDQEIGCLLLAEMSVRSKVHTLGALVRRCEDSRTFNPWVGGVQESWSILEKQCLRAIDKRNAAVHSSWALLGCPEAQAAVRRRTLVRGKQGFRVQEEQLTSTELLDLAEYILGVISYLDEFLPV